MILLKSAILFGMYCYVNAMIFGSDLITLDKETSSSAQQGALSDDNDFPPLNSQVDAAVKVGVMKCFMNNRNNRTAAVTGAQCVSKRVSRAPP